MRSLPSLTFTLAASALLLGPALADDWKWDPKTKKSAPKVGRRTFDDYVEVTKNKIVVKAGGQVVQDKRDASTVTVRVIREILAMEGEDVTKERFTIEKWSNKPADEEEDKSLEGKTILAEGLGADRKTTIEGTPEPEVSDAAKEWIQKEITNKGGRRKEKDKKDEIFNPKEPVAPDGEWTIDPAALAQELFKAEVIAEKSSAKGKLTNVRVEDGKHHGKVDINASIQLKAMPGAPIEWSEGGLLKMSVSMDGLLDGTMAGENGKLAMEVALKGKAKQESPQGAVAVSMDIHVKRDGTAGELPAK